MKKLIYFIALGLLVLTQACYEDYKFDYSYTSTYYAKQFPIRSVILDPSEELTFEVGVVLAGKYINESTEKVNFQVEPALIDSFIGEYPDLKLLPSSYYELSNENEFVIEPGSVNGNVTVKLNKELVLNDSLATTPTYVLPLRITSSSTDSILTEKNFTVVMVRYYNPFHGSYWLRGVDYTLNTSGEYSDTATYTNDDLVLNRDLLLQTVGEKEVLSTYIGSNSSGDGEDYSMKIKIRDDGVCELDGVNLSDLSSLIGGGRYSDIDKTFVLDYSYYDAAGALHDVIDTLFYRNIELSVEAWLN